ncbi:NfeD family protein [Fretibacter rubidus]|uniref:NfeD family protein n=1 Tax=Fretibacter rubidus TaxID=570162 RepID=UPI00352ADD9D
MDADNNIIVAWLEAMSGMKWMIIGALLLILELVTGTTYILWPAFAALAVGVFAFVLPIGWEMQFLLFFILSTVLLVFGHVYVRPRVKGGEPSDLNDRARAMVGMRVKAIADFETGQGRVQVGDTQWRARLEDGNAKSGDELRVVHVDGTTLVCVTA